MVMMVVITMIFTQGSFAFADEIETTKEPVETVETVQETQSEPAIEEEPEVKVTVQEAPIAEEPVVELEKSAEPEVTEQPEPIVESAPAAGVTPVEVAEPVQEETVPEAATIEGAVLEESYAEKDETATIVAEVPVKAASADEPSDAPTVNVQAEPTEEQKVPETNNAFENDQEATLPAAIEKKTKYSPASDNELADGSFIPVNQERS